MLVANHTGLPLIGDMAHRVPYLWQGTPFAAFFPSHCAVPIGTAVWLATDI